MICIQIGGLPSGNAGDASLIPGLGRSTGVGNGNPLHYSCLETSMDRGAWWAIVHGVAKSQTWLSLGKSEWGSRYDMPNISELHFAHFWAEQLCRLQFSWKEKAHQVRAPAAILACSCPQIFRGVISVYLAKPGQKLVFSPLSPLSQKGLLSFTS